MLFICSQQVEEKWSKRRVSKDPLFQKSSTRYADWFWPTANDLARTHPHLHLLSFTCCFTYQVGGLSCLITVGEMQSPLFSEGEDGPSPEKLLKQNRIKDLALSKASNLIELLNIELEVERNSSQEALRALQEQLRERYEKQLRELQERVQFLERELKKNSTNDKTIRSTVLTRANSARSLQNKLKRSSVNKKFSDTIPNEEGSKVYPATQVSGELYRLEMQQLEEWRRVLVGQLNSLIKTEYDQLEKIINRIEEASENCNIISARQKPSRDVSGELMEIVRTQNKVINSLTAYSQELENLCKSTNYKLISLLNKQESKFSICQPDFAKVIQQLYGMVRIREEELKVALASLQGENGQLKNILDSMIQLVKQEKKIR